MARGIYILLLIFLKLTEGKYCVKKEPKEVSWEKKLREDLKLFSSNRAGRSGPPELANCETPTVNIKFVLKYFTFNIKEEVLMMKTWMFVSWTDTRLKWDPNKYGGVKTTEMRSSSMWTPSFALFNSIEVDVFGMFFLTRCSLKYTGHILCVLKVTHNAICGIKLAHFPYDVQECTLQFGVWPTENQNFKTNFSSQAMLMWGADHGSQWTISSYRQETQQDQRSRLNMTFILEREALGLASVIVYPSIIISALTVACLFVDVRHDIRLVLVCFSVLSHYYFLSRLDEKIPNENVDPPTILLYYRGSLVLTVFVLVMTFILTVLGQKENAPHRSVVSINNYVYGSFGRFLVFPQWENLSDVRDGLETNDEKGFKEEWTKFVVSVSSLCNIVIIFAYLALYCAFMP